MLCGAHTRKSILAVARHSFFSSFLRLLLYFVFYSQIALNRKGGENVKMSVNFYGYTHANNVCVCARTRIWVFPYDMSIKCERANALAIQTDIIYLISPAHTIHEFPIYISGTQHMQQQQWRFAKSHDQNQFSKMQTKNSSKRNLSRTESATYFADS